jgi:serine/threonine protein kinase
MTETKEISAVKVVFLKEEELREILLEVEILRDCSHKNIVKLLGHFKKETDLWICMEFCGGGAVDTLYKNLQRQLNETEIGILIGECLRGLVYLHEEMHIIHRDIKSGNMLLTETGEVKLADFGVSALTIKVREYRANSFIGTPYWMAPEVILVENSRTETYDCKADIWSIGITCIELADKNPPLSDIHPMRALYLIPTASPTSLMLQQPQKWSKPFVAFIQSCLVKDPHRRISALECFHTPYLEKVSDTAGQNGGTKKIMLDLIQEVRGHKLGIKNSTKQEPVKKDDSSDEQFANFDLESNSTEKSDIKSTSSSTNRKNSSGFLRFFRNSTTDYIPLFLSIEESVISIVKQSERFNDIVPLFESNMKVNSSDIISFTALKAGNPFVYTFLLLAGEKNIFACDISEKSDYIYADGSDRLRLLIPEAKVKEIIIVEDYGIMLARGGRRNEIRQYRLQSIIKLLLHVFKIDSPGDEDYNIEDSLFRRQSPIFWSKDYFKVNSTDLTFRLSIQRSRFHLLF